MKRADGLMRVGEFASVSDLRAEGEGGTAEKAKCTLAAAPGNADLKLTERAAQEKFCAAPAVKVFD